MVRYLAILMLGSAALAQTSQPAAGHAAKAVQDPVLQAEEAALPPMPPTPQGTSTVIGGFIRDIDPVMDEMTVKVFGGQAMKVLFDARTQVFRDGKKTTIADLHANDRASVQTTRDGDNVYALSVHMLSQAPEGQTQGQVESYDPGTGELIVRDALSQNPITLLVRSDTPITRTGQATFASGSGGTADLAPGSLVSVTFTSNQGQGVARQISILATPGSSFTFAGTISSLDLSSQILVVTDPRDGKSYTISFDSASLPATRNLHEGQKVMVRAHFDGSRYVANTISPQ
jgi:hypothetical protein